jgi:hypothetical protein
LVLDHFLRLCLEPLLMLPHQLQVLPLVVEVFLL